jgi:hypothetical protein
MAQLTLVIAVAIDAMAGRVEAKDEKSVLVAEGSR